MTELLTSVLQQEKRCIFCGNPPSEKTREHVIPQWLIELTGDPKRIWHLGVKFDDPSKSARRFAADQFQFPACEACNSRYSDLEGRTKANITKLLNEQSLSAADWDDLMDWFDKVRIGLFIGNMILNKDLPVPDPKFFIDQRIGAKDRCVLVYPNRADYVGLRMIGAADPVFFHQPTSFMLLINKLLFVNLSSDFLLAPRMGFPFPRKIEMAGPGMRADDLWSRLRRSSGRRRGPGPRLRAAAVRGIGFGGGICGARGDGGGLQLFLRRPGGCRRPRSSAPAGTPRADEVNERRPETPCFRLLWFPGAPPRRSHRVKRAAQALTGAA